MEVGVQKKICIDYKMTIGKDNTELCLTLFNMAAPYYENIRLISVWTRVESVGAVGERECGKVARKCLNDITLADIKSFCDTCTSEKEVCNLAMTFYL